MKRQYFQVEEDSLNKGKFIVTLKIVIYRQMHGKYPDFLANFGTKEAERFGYTTKFWYLAKKENGEPLEDLTEEIAIENANILENKYGSLIKNCEDTGDWTNYPFKNLLLMYHK